MKRSWFGVGLLAALLILSLLAGWGMDRCQAPVARDLEEASRCALAEDWTRTRDLALGAMDHWERWRPFRAVLENQRAMAEVDSLFARLEIFLQTQDPQAAALCAEIARRVADLRPSADWWDLV